MERFKGPRLFLYNLSTAGHALFDTLLLFYAAQFFLPTAENIEEGMVQFVPVLILGFIPVLGLLMVFGRIVDAITDPPIAAWSDRSRSPLGRRRFFLIVSGVPLALSTGLVFFPPFHFTSTWNIFYLALVFGLYFLFYTMYVAPYIALIPELGHSEKERLNITTAQGYFALVGAGLVMIGGPMLYGTFLKTSNPVSAFQLMVVILCAVGAVLLYLAVFVVNEKRYSDAKPCAVPFMESLKKTLGNRPFIIFMLTNMCFWFMFNTIRGSVNHIGQTLMMIDEETIGLASIIIFVGAAVFFPLALFLSRKIGKKTVMITGMALFAFFSVLTSLTGLGSNPDGLTCNYANSITKQGGTVWIGTARGISTFDGTHWRYYDNGSGLTDNSVSSAVARADGSLWFGTKNGISVYANGTWTAQAVGQGTGPQQVTALAVDGGGTLWCGTKGGLFSYASGQWQAHTEKDGPAQNAVTALITDAKGAVWAGTENGLFAYDGGSWRSFSQPDGPADTMVTALAAAPDGTVWCGTKNGLSAYRDGTWTTYKKADGLINNRITALAAATDGTLWAGTKDGVSVFDGSGWKTYVKADGLVNNYVSAVLVTGGSDVWFATHAGVSHLAGGVWENYFNSGPFIWALVIFALFGFSVAVLLIVPNVFISDLCDYDYRNTGEHREGIYFGVHGFFMKLNLGISFALMSFFYAIFGKDISNPLGVRLSCIAISVIGILGIIIFLRYPVEKVKGKSG
jgi:GPH family glycoside/pentoside/hexuronide:cation symporter